MLCFLLVDNVGAGCENWVGWKLEMTLSALCAALCICPYVWSGHTYTFHFHVGAWVFVTCISAQQAHSDCRLWRLHRIHRFCPPDLDNRAESVQIKKIKNCGHQRIQLLNWDTAHPAVRSSSPEVRWCSCFIQWVNTNLLLACLHCMIILQGSKIIES